MVAASARPGETWPELARQAERLGYATLLVPDTFDLLSPFPAAAAAATATESLHVGTFVLDVSVRHPASVAHETVSLDVLSGGRFELGLGTGRTTPEERERRGLPPVTPAQRLERLAETVVEAARVAPHPPILVAAFGPRALGIAARHADVVSFATPPATTEDRLEAKADEFRALAGDRIGQVELAMNLLAVGEEIPDWLVAVSGLSRDALPADTVTVLPGDPQKAADTLLRRRDRTGISYITVNSGFAERLAPVIELLHDR